MKITVLLSSPTHPIFDYLQNWAQKTRHYHEVDLVHSRNELGGGDILFLISCSEIVDTKDWSLYAKTLVLHASDLPVGRGWSPHIWQIANGASEITVSLLEAQEKVDTGDIWHKIRADIPDTALWDEINHILFTAELQLMDYAIKHFDKIEPQPQNPEIPPTYFPKRAPKNSQIDTHKPLADQFDLLRVCDPDRYPAYFEFRDRRYILKLEKFDDT